MEIRWLFVIILFLIGFFSFKNQEKFKWATKLFFIGAASGLSVKSSGIFDALAATFFVGLFWSLVGSFVDVMIAFLKKRKKNQNPEIATSAHESSAQADVQIKSGDEFNLEKAIATAKKNKSQ